MYHTAKTKLEFLVTILWTVSQYKLQGTKSEKSCFPNFAKHSTFGNEFLGDKMYGLMS